MDRRDFLRVEVDIQGELFLADRRRVPVQVKNLSGGGVQLQCDTSATAAVVPNGSCIDERGRPIEVDLRFRLENKLFQVHCRVVFVRRVSHGVYHIGMRFTDLLQEDVFKLEKLLLSRSA